MSNCVAAEVYQGNVAAIIGGLSQLMTCRNALIVKNAAIALAKLQSKPTGPDLGLSSLDLAEMHSASGAFMRALANAIQFSAEIL